MNAKQGPRRTDPSSARDSSISKLDGDSMANRSNLPIKADFAKVRRLIGKGGDKLIPEAFGVAEDSALGKELDEVKGEVFKTRYLSQLQLSPGARPLLSRLRRDGIR